MNPPFSAVDATQPDPGRRFDRFPPASTGRWCPAARDDPITGLICWPDFRAAFPRLLGAALRNDRAVGLAIGDVDDLKAYVESARAGNPESYGHLAGNDLMSRLGGIARTWWRQANIEQGCVATFGGDEIVVAGEIPDAALWTGRIGDLRDQISFLPCSASFASTTVTPADVLVDIAGDEWIREYANHLIRDVDQALFITKRQRRATSGPGGTVTTVAPPAGR